jgi:hypothetical protein
MVEQVLGGAFTSRAESLVRGTIICFTIRSLN